MCSCIYNINSMDKLKKILIEAVAISFASTTSFLIGYFYSKKHLEKRLNIDGDISIVKSSNKSTGFMLSLPNDDSIEELAKKPYAIFKVKVIIDDFDDNGNQNIDA